MFFKSVSLAGWTVSPARIHQKYKGNNNHHRTFKINFFIFLFVVLLRIGYLPVRKGLNINTLRGYNTRVYNRTEDCLYLPIPGVNLTTPGKNTVGVTSCLRCSYAVYKVLIKKGGLDSSVV